MIEAKVDRGQGTVATVVVKRGTLRVRAHASSTHAQSVCVRVCSLGVEAERRQKLLAVCVSCLACGSALTALTSHPLLRSSPLPQVGQPMVVGTEWGRVRALRGTGGKPIAEALPGQPAEISGLKGLPQAGDQLLVGSLHPPWLAALLASCLVARRRAAGCWPGEKGHRRRGAPCTRAPRLHACSPPLTAHSPALPCTRWWTARSGRR